MVVELTAASASAFPPRLGGKIAVPRCWIKYKVDIYTFCLGLFGQSRRIKIVIVVAIFAVANMIILEATLSFLGLGVEPDIVTWGRMLNGGRLYLGSAWWITAFPGLAIFLTVLAVNLLGDHLRDWLDPRLRNTVRGDQL